MARKRIHNPRTRHYYALQLRTGRRRRGQIKGLWRFKKRGRFDIIREIYRWYMY